MKLDEKLLLSSSKYASALDSAVVEQNVAPETYIYLLKNQLVDAALFNQNLRCVISILIWNLHMERANASIKTEMARVLQQSVDSLEGLLRKSSGMQQTFRERYEKLDYEISLLQDVCTKEVTGRNLASFACARPLIHRTLQRHSFVQHARNLSEAASSTQVAPPSAANLEDEGPMQICLVSEQEEEAQKTDSREEKISNKKTIASYKLVSAAGGALELKARRWQRPEPVIRKEHELLKRTCQEAQTELAWNRTLMDLLMSELGTTRLQLSALRKQVQDIAESSQRLVKDESANWQRAMDSLKENCDRELERKQENISGLHALLAKWMFKYMELEKTKGTERENPEVTAMREEY